MVAHAPAAAGGGRAGRYLAPTALAGLVAAVVAVIVGFPGSAAVHQPSTVRLHAAHRRLPPYWTVRPGDTYAEIAAKTGLTTAQLEAFNPDIDPMALIPGERLNLWRHPPKPRPKPPLPQSWLVKPGE